MNKQNWRKQRTIFFSRRVISDGTFEENREYFMARRSLVGLDLFIVEVSRSHSDTRQSAWLLLRSDQPEAQTSTWQHTTLTRQWHPCLRRDSNPQSQLVSDRTHTRFRARPLGSARNVLLWPVPLTLVNKKWCNFAVTGLNNFNTGFSISRCTLEIGLIDI